MPRGRKRTTVQTITEEIEKIDTQIESYEGKVKTLKDKRKALVEQKKKQDLEILYAKIQESGKSMDEILNLVKA